MTNCILIEKVLVYILHSRKKLFYQVVLIFEAGEEINLKVMFKTLFINHSTQKTLF